MANHRFSLGDVEISKAAQRKLRKAREQHGFQEDVCYVTTDDVLLINYRLNGKRQAIEVEPGSWTWSKR